MASVNRFCLHFFNLLFFVGAAGVVAVAFFLHTNIRMITSLLDDNEYLNDNYKPWIPASPWICAITALLVCLTPVFGVIYALRKSRKFLVLFTFLMILDVLILIGASLVVYNCVDEESTGLFISDAIRRIFDKSQKYEEIQAGFNNIEVSLRCCGAASPRDYSKLNYFSEACCDGRECGIDDELAHEKKGCSKVAAEKTKWYITAMYSTSFATAIVGVFAVIFAVITILTLKKKVKTTPDTVQKDRLKLIPDKILKDLDSDVEYHKKEKNNNCSNV